MANFKIEGMRELKRSIRKLEQVPQKCVTSSSRKGMNIALKAAKQGGWVDESGEMRKGMKLVGEKTRIKGKKVYQLVFDRAKNNVFQKQVKKPGQGRRKIAYYPASQNYGFYTRDGRYIPGFHFMERALMENNGTIAKKIVDEMIKEIDKALKG